jgi:hypothetical protein
VSNEGTVFVNRTDTNSRCEPFTIDKRIKPGAYKLGSADDSKGIYTIMFSDTTILPGRFKIAIGEMEIDIMPHRIVIDGNELKWH